MLSVVPDGNWLFCRTADEGWNQVFDIYAQSMILNQPYRNRGGGDVAVADLEGDGDLDVVISWGDAIEVLQATTNPFAFVARAAFSRPAGYSTGSFWDDWGGPDGPSLSLGTSTGTIRVQED